MVNLVILSLFALILLTTRRREGTTRVNGLFFGLTCAKVGRVGVVVFSYRHNRIYWKVGAL